MFSRLKKGFKKLTDDMGKGKKHKYNKGWAPHATKSSSTKTTVRDAGLGSSSYSDYKTAGGDDGPPTWEQVRDECLEQGTLWEDPDFPCDASSIFYQNPPSVWPNVEFKRPPEICDDPQLFVDGATRMDVKQGILGDCWLLAGVAGLATNERLLHRVVPDNQSFNEGEYAGVFRFLFWQYGRWVEVLVDDRLPTCNNKLIYMHSDDRNEFWSALLEKAYAKLCGCYECLSGGLTSEAMTDFTGGVVERFELRDKAPEDLWPTMLHARKRLSLMGCSIDASPDQMEAELDNGLIIGHAYTITDVRNVETENGPVNLVRSRNPWGSEHEWKGAWGDESDEWNSISEEDREALGLTFEDDGEFWMSFEDWSTEFQRLEICYLGPDTLLDEDEGELADSVGKWEGNLNIGSWRRRVNAGGCRNYNTFWTNPQYRITIEDADEDDDEGTQRVVIGVMQKDRRKMRAQGERELTIGYAVYKLDDPNRGTLDERWFKTNAMVAKSGTFTNLREVSDHHRLEPGDYVVIPSTFEPNEEGDFIVRVISEKPDDMAELDDETATAEPDAEELGDDDDEEPEKADRAKAAFEAIAGEDGEISAYELKDVLNQIFMEEFEFDGFSTDMCRSMVAMKDADLSGKLGFSDFTDLWSDLRLCRKAFKMLDTDGNSYFESYEFRRVLNTMAPALGLQGLKVSNATFNAIVMRYSDNDGHVRFDDCVACFIKLKCMFETYKDNDQGGEASFGQDEFIQLTMYT